ncbi:MAG: Ig-like domain-containing protein [Rikenellaceae bacterium]
MIEKRYNNGSAKAAGASKFLMLFVAALFIASLFSRCANIGSPTGGPKDTLPPVILNMTPDNFSTNTDIYLKKVYIEFDEFVQIQDQHKHFYTSPKMTHKPQLSLRGRGVVVTLRDTLQENTTYSLNFGSSIQDNNEGNPLHSMRYVFSTGNEIDSMIVSGYTEDSYQADSVSRTFILFFPADSLDNTAEYDSTIFNREPVAIARAENNGIFLAQNLKPIPYRVYAYEDKNDNQQYDPGSDKVGFINEIYNPLEMDEFAIWFDTLRKYVVAEPQMHFRMFLDEKAQRQVMTTNTRPTQNKVILSFGAPNPQIDSIIFDSIPQDRIVIQYLREGRDSMAIWIKDRDEDRVTRDGFSYSTIPDTLRGRVVYNRHDSLNNLVSYSQDLRLLWRTVESREQEQARKKLEKERDDAVAKGEEWSAPERPNDFNISFSSTKEINPLKSLDLTFNYPLEQFDTSAVTLLRVTKREAEFEEERYNKVLDSKDSLAIAQYKPYMGSPINFEIERDSLNLLLWRLTSDTWGEFGDKFTLQIAEGAITDIMSGSNKEVSNNYTLIDESEYASIKLKIKEDEHTPSKYIVELLNQAGTTVLDRKIGVDPGEVLFRFVQPGNVSLRITQDLNNNGIWDSGSLLQRREPERAQRIVADNGESTISTRKNWEVELSVDPQSLFKRENTRELAARLDKEEQLRLASRCNDVECQNPNHNHSHNRDGADDHHGHSHIH